MAISINDFRMAIRIDNSEAKIKFAETKEQIASVTAEMKKLEAEGKKNSDEYKALKQKQDELNTSLANYRKEGVRSSMTYAELRKGAAQLKREMDRTTPGTEKWKALRADFLLTKQRMKELEVQARDTRFSLSKVADGFNRYAAIGAGAVASLTGVVLTARKCVDEYAEMEEAEAQVIKYTGMTKNEVKELNEEFKQMDTRTAREKLNALAGDAGRLGITGKKDVLEFVDAADKINVALGEDLGEDAVKNIGKLAQMFGEDEKLGLRGAMLATGSAINEVAQNSSAAEAYLVGFTARVAGAANQAKVAQGDILGYASVLDQNMQQQEMAATAFQTLVMKMFQEPAKFAKIAGQSVEDFASLIKKDANEAILQFLDTLHKKGGLDQLAPMFKEMGLDGVRASGVISTMAGKIDDIREAQKLANDAYRDGTSATKEYNVQNNTVQAELDKAKNAFKNVRVELGENLQPVMKYMITTGSMTVKGLNEIISIFSEYKTAILLATASIAGYTIAVKASVIADKAKVLWTGKIVAGLKTLYATVKANPWAMIIAAGMGLIGYLVDLKKKQDSVNESMKSLARVNNNSQKQYDEQASRVKLLTALIHNENLANKQRKDALNELKELIPGYNGLLTDEGKLINDNTSAIESYLVQLEKQIKMKAAQEELEELFRRKRETERQLKTDLENETTAKKNLAGAEFVASNRSQQASTSGTKALNMNLDQGVKTMRTEFEKAADAVANTKEQLKSVEQAIVDITDEIKKAEFSDIAITEPTKTGDEDKCPVCGNKPCTCGNDVDKAIKAREDALKQAMQEERNLWKEEYLNHEHTEEEYNQALYDSEMMFLLKKKALLESYGKDTSAIQGQIYDKMIAEANRLAQVAKNADKKAQSDNLAVIEKEYQIQRAALKQAYISGDIKRETDYQEQLKELERQYLKERRDMLAAYGEDVSSIDTKLQDMDLSDKKEGQDKQREQGFKEIDSTSSFSQKNNILQAMYDADLITFEEYQEEKTRIAEEQEQVREDTAKAAFDVIGQAAAAAGQVVSALQDAEVSKVTRQYDKKIKAAKKAGKDTTKLEEEKEEAINQVKKKYADKQFAAAVLQVTASTAVAAMEAYKAMAGIPIVGPALGAIAAAAAVASGAAQIAVAKQQRDEAKGLKSGGYVDEYVEGYTDNGNPDDVAGVIPVHKNEFVTNHEGVANPHVRQFLDVFDVAQKNGTIRMINTTQILEQVRTHSGKYSGGYTEDTSSSRSFAGSPTESTPELRSQIVELLQRNNELLAAIRDKDLVVDPRKVRDGIKRVEFLEKNISR